VRGAGALTRVGGGTRLEPRSQILTDEARRINPRGRGSRRVSICIPGQECL